MEIKGIYKTNSNWRMEIQAGRTVYSLTLDEAWKLALEIIQAIGAHCRSEVEVLTDELETVGDETERMARL